jgi:small subunit ribosomal protein S20
VLKDGSGFNPLRRQEVAIHKSVIKRQKQAEKQQLINKSAKSLLKTLAKKVEQAVEAKNADVAKAAMVNAMKAYDKAASKGILHKNTASRKISRLSMKVGKITAA